MPNIVQDDNYYQISGWMINRLGLKGVALNVYAIIYGYSQAESNVFSGSRQYLADFIGVTRPTVDNAIASLIEKGYITKFSSVINGVTFVSYKATPSILQGVKNFDTPCKKTLHNNKEYNKEKENYIKESCENRNGNQVTTSFVANNENQVKLQSVELGTVTPTSTNTNMFVVNNEQNELHQKVIVEELHSDYDDVINFFNKTYSIYPRKEGKVQAKTTYTHKVYSNDAELNKLIATRIYKCLQRQIIAWENENNGSGRDKQYIPLFSSWLNNNFEDIPKKDRGKKQ